MVLLMASFAQCAKVLRRTVGAIMIVMMDQQMLLRTAKFTSFTEEAAVVGRASSVDPAGVGVADMNLAASFVRLEQAQTTPGTCTTSKDLGKTNPKGFAAPFTLLPDVGTIPSGLSAFGRTGPRAESSSRPVSSSTRKLGAAEFTNIGIHCGHLPMLAATAGG